MLLFPAIDLRRGHCVRLHQGDFARETVYGDDPVAVAKGFEEAGAPWIHVVDLDAARGQGSNRDVVTAIASAVSVPVQTGGGVRDASLLEAGVERIVVGSMAVTDRRAAGDLVAAHPTRVAIGLDHRQGEVRTKGWEQGSGVRLLDALSWPEFIGVGAFVVTNIERDATMEGPDLDGLHLAVEAAGAPVIASGGVGTLDHIRAVRDLGVTGVIVGKALYEGRFTVEEAVAACAA
ncbi:MAG: phosphoribosylformimino-5-aminoimidazole carboxamide ribotide isomerase [Actinomycetota bacterium]